MRQRPRFAVVSPNTLLCLGMKSLLESIIPQVEVVVASSIEQIANREFVFHYFVSADVASNSRATLATIQRRVIILTDSSSADNFEGFHTIGFDQPEEAIRQTIMAMQNQGHAPATHTTESIDTPLTPREREVLILLVRGFINKEIADRLAISLTTVISHRRNIVEKLKLRSLSSLTVYAISKRLIDPREIIAT